MRSARGSRTSQSSTGGSKNEKNGGTNNSQKKSSKGKNKDIVDIQPIVYSFRVPSNPSPGSIMNAMLPPYWLYHDHAFGVIWMLFNQDKKYIGITQLHWCLRFLLDLKNTEGEYTGDVNACIQAVQDDLLEQYANLGTILENESSESKNKDKSRKSERETTNEEKAETGPTDSGETEGKEGREEATSSSGQQGQSKLGKQASTCSSIDESHNFSLTYNEMVSRGPAPYTEQTPLEQIYRAGPTTTTEIVTSTPDVAAMLTSDTSPPDKPLAEMGTEELVNFLNCSREEHVERIKKEIERLHDLEKFMEGLDKQGFKAYVTDDVARRLDQMDGQGVVREVDGILK